MTTNIPKKMVWGMYIKDGISSSPFHSLTICWGTTLILLFEKKTEIIVITIWIGIFLKLF